MYIREYQTEDFESCMNLFDSNMPLFFAPHERDLFKNWLNKRQAKHSSIQHKEGDVFYVLEEAGEILACGGFYLVENGTQARMSWGMVRNDHHHKGIGKALLLFRIKRIKELFPECVVALDTSQHSFEFFAKLGFDLIKITENSYAPGLHRYDMELRN